jgi:hypothetical protein
MYTGWASDMIAAMRRVARSTMQGDLCAVVTVVVEAFELIEGRFMTVEDRLTALERKGKDGCPGSAT